MFVVLAVFDVLAAIVVWALIRASGPRPPLNSLPASRGDHVSKESIR
jgi:ACS family hexuronate transporter-like MFS transporter